MKHLLDVSWIRERHVCPWWVCFIFDNFLRRIIHDAEEILGSYVARGDIVLDIGPGMGYFSIPLARMVGETGRVIAVDVQPKMLAFLQQRAKKAGIERRVTTHLCRPDMLGIDRQVDFVLAFWMVHEVLDQGAFFQEAKSILKPSGKMLVAEPKIHVSRATFQKTVEAARSVALVVKEEPKIALSWSVVLTRGPEDWGPSPVIP